MPDNIHRPYGIDKSKMATAFSQVAFDYDELAVLQRRVGTRLLDRLDDIQLSPNRILDLGSGTGRLSFKLSEHYTQATVWGCDLAHGMVSYALSQKAINHYPKLAFVCADAESLPFPDESFDCVFSNLMLQWCSNLPMALKEIRRVLKPKGVYLFSTLGSDTLHELRVSWEATESKMPLHRFVDMPVLANQLTQQHFYQIVLDQDCFMVTYRAVEDILQDFRKIGAINAVQGRRSLGLLGRQRFQRFLDAYEVYRDKDDRLPVTYDVLYGYALRGT